MAHLPFPLAFQTALGNLHYCDGLLTAFGLTCDTLRKEAAVTAGIRALAARMPWYPDDLESHVNPTELTLNPTVTVTKRTPPTFLVQAENDPVDDVRNSLAYFLALKNAKVPV